MRNLSLTAVTAAYFVAAPLFASDDWQMVHSTVSQAVYSVGAQPPLPNQQITAWTDTLQLDEDQIEILRGLQADAENQFRFDLLEYREAAADAQAQAMILQDWTLTEKAQTALSEQTEQLREAILEDTTAQLKLIITPEQEALWPKLEQTERRTRILSAPSAVPGFSLDVVAAVRSSISDAEVHAALQPVLDSYADELDPVLISLERAMDELATQVRDKESAEKDMWSRSEASGGEMDWEAWQEQSEQAAQAIGNAAMRVHGMCERVAAINTRALQNVIAELPSESAGSIQAFASRLKPASSSPGWFSPMASDLFNARSTQAFISLLPDDPESAESDSEGMFGGVSFQQMMAFQRRAMELARAEFPEIAEQWGSFMPVATADLTQDQVSQLRAIRASFRQAKERIEQRHASTIRPIEDTDSGNRLVVPAKGGAVYLARGDAAENPWGGKAQAAADDDGVAEYQEQLLELDQETIEQIRRVLTPEQRLSILNF